jgi:hypothetical protein
MGQELILYGTSGCHLCEIAAEIVIPVALKAGLSLHQVDIAGNTELEALYETSIPVLCWFNHELKWPFDSAAVTSLITICRPSKN